MDGAAKRLRASSGRRRAPDLVERDAELARLDALVASAADGGQVVLLSGEAGTGKSSLLEALRHRVEGTSVVRSGRCDPLTTPAPFGPLYEMRASLPAALAAALEEGRRELLFAELLEELGRTPSVFIVDDVHWADEATVDLLRYIGRRIGDTRSLLVCAFRDEEVDPRHPLRTLLGELASLAHRIELRSLTVRGVTRLVEDRGLDPVALHELTGGNPFFVTQMLLHPGTEVPATVEDAVLARTRSLPDRAWDVLDVVGISPEGVPLWVLPALGATTEDAADAACRLGLLTIEGDRLRARHELIRRTFERSVAPTRRRRLHSRLLELAADRSETALDIAVLAHHAVGAGDPARTIEYSLRAARRAAADGAHRQAAAHYADALRHRELLHGAQRMEVLEGHAYERYLIGDFEAAAESIAEGVACASTARDRGRCLRLQSRFCWFRGDRQAAERSGRLAVEVLEAEPTDPHELAYAYSNLAQLAMLTHDHDAVRTWGHRAVSLARQHGDVEVLAHALNNLGTNDPDPEGRRRLVGESLAVSLEHDLHEHAARAYTNLAFHEVWERQLDEARRLLDQGLAYTEARDLGAWWVYMVGIRSELDLVAGRWGDAASGAARVRSVAAGPLTRHQATTVAARLALRRDSADATSLVTEALDEAMRIGEHVRLVSACSVALEHRWHTGEPVWDRSMERQIIDMAARRGDTWGVAQIGFWGLLLDESPPPPPHAPPIEAAVEGAWTTAAAAWERYGCGFEAALAAAHAGDTAGRRAAVAALTRLGAEGTLRALRRRLHDRGIHDIPRGPNRATRTNTAGLTARQLEVLHLLALGASNGAIADELVISPKTVEHHVSAILAKLGASSRAEAGALARAQGLV